MKLHAKKNRGVKLSRGEKIYVVIVNIIMILAALSCLLPVLHVFAKSLSSVSAVAGSKVWFWPVDFNPEGWKYILNRTSFLRSLGNSAINALCGTVISLVVTVLTAYSLSHEHLKMRKGIIALYVFIMIFNAGMLPNYFQVKEYNLINTRWALILPTLISPYNTFVLKNALENVPSELEESARIDGASYSRILFSIIIPVSKAAIATIVVFTAVGYWNRYFDALLYITQQKLKPAALLLYEVIKLSAQEEGLGEVELAAVVSPEIKNASIVMMTMLPILAVYPFMQRYFVKGVMAGSVKG